MHRFRVTTADGQRVVEGTTARETIVVLLSYLDTVDLHLLQIEDLPRARNAAVMDPNRVPAIVIPPASCEYGWDHEAEFDEKH